MASPRQSLALPDIQFSDEKLNRLAQATRAILSEMQRVQQLLAAGDAGEILTKNSRKDYDAGWSSAGSVAGKAGSVWRSGHGTPSPTLGVDGDFYLDASTGNVFQRVSGVYGLVANIEGPEGPQGADGKQGLSGPAGAVGAVGAPGLPGIPGQPGSPGFDGEEGGDGSPGPPGLTGARGPQGIAGPTGPSGGPVGPRGPPGMDGEIGEMGLRGDTGPIGPRGLIGATGATGATGTRGLQGVVGRPGFDGEEGPIGEWGPPGPRGAAGAAGARGLTGVQGVRGLAGPPGLDGEHGEDSHIILLPGAGGGASSPLTTKGDLWGYGSGNARVPAGSNGQVLTADSTQTLGLKWAASGASVAVPGTIKDLVCWWESDDILASTGSVIVKLRERTPWISGIAAQNVAGGLAVDASTLNSLPVLTFPAATSTGLYSLQPGTSLKGGATFFVVIRASTAAGTQAIWGGGGGSLAFYLSNIGGGKFLLVATGSAVVATATSAWTAGSWVQANVTYNATTGAYAFRQGRAANGSGTATTGYGTGASTSIGGDASTNFVNAASIAALIVYNRALAPTEITNLENYLNTKWGV